MWHQIMKKPLLLASGLAVLVALTAVACAGGISQGDYDSVKGQLQAKEQEVALLKVQLEQQKPVFQVGQLLPVAARATPTGWDTKWSQLLGITLLAQFDSSGPDAWDVAKNPVVYVVTHGPGYSGILSPKTKLPGIAIVNATTREVVATTHYDTKEASYDENHGVAVSADGKWLYTQGQFQGKHALLVINARTLKIDKILRAGLHHAKAYRDAATGKELILVDDHRDWTPLFFALDPSDDSRVVGAVDPADLRGSGYLAFTDPAGKELWITVRTGFGTEGGVAVVDLKTWRVTKRIATEDSSTVWVTFSNNGKYAYVSGARTSTVAKVDRAKGEVVAVVSAATAGPYGITLSMDEKLLVTVGKGEGGNTNEGITVGLVDPATARAVTTRYTGCIRGDHGIINPVATNELWISCNSSFETVVFDMAKLEVIGRVKMPDGGSNHNGAFIRYKPDWSAELLSDTNGLHNSMFEAQTELLAKQAVK